MTDLLEELDEIQWSLPEAIQFYGGVHTNSVHLYFMQSPFFDHTSNNNVIRTQAEFNPGMHHLLASRASFEERLRTMQGLEFVVVDGPKPDADTGVWVINKQVRRKRAGQHDDLAIMGTYFVVGENIYQAPSVLDIVQNRLVGAPVADHRVTNVLAVHSAHAAARVRCRRGAGTICARPGPPLCAREEQQ